MPDEGIAADPTYWCRSWLHLLCGDNSMSSVMSPSTIVRMASPDDAVQVGEAHASAWAEGYSGLFAPGVLTEAVSLRRSLWTYLFADPAFDFEGMLVAEQDGEVVGFSQFGRSNDGVTLGEVFAFYACPRVWGTGVSAAMMEATLATLQSPSLLSVMIWTHAGAARARAFYEKSGFALTGRERIGTLAFGLEAPEVEYSSSVDVV